jgi:hypothetical protein
MHLTGAEQISGRKDPSIVSHVNFCSINSPTMANYKLVMTLNAEWGSEFQLQMSSF